MNKLLRLYLIYSLHFSLFGTGQHIQTPPSLMPNNPSECQQDSDCTLYDINSECKYQGVCRCKINFTKRRGKCAKAVGLGQLCSSDRQCTASDMNTRCQGVCSCDEGYSRMGNICIQAIGLGQLCSNDHQCILVDKNTRCQTICSCNEGYSHVGNTCIQAIALGQLCSNDRQCILVDKNSRCQTVCSCNEGYSRVENTCIQAIDLGQSCSSDLQCILSDANSVCQTICTCNEGYFHVRNICNYATKLGQFCLDDIECINSDANSQCQTVCKCGHGYLQKGSHCVKDYSQKHFIPKSPTDSVSLTAIIGTVICVIVLLISLFLCAYRQHRKTRSTLQANRRQPSEDVEMPPRESSLRRSIRSLISRLPYSDPPPPYDIVVAQKNTVNNQSNPPSYTEIFQSSQQHTNRAFVPDPVPSNI